MPQGTRWRAGEAPLPSELGSSKRAPSVLSAAAHVGPGPGSTFFFDFKVAL
jgi:hypothetical protein